MSPRKVPPPQIPYFFAEKQIPMTIAANCGGQDRFYVHLNENQSIIDQYEAQHEKMNQKLGSEKDRKISLVEGQEYAFYSNYPMNPSIDGFYRCTLEKFVENETALIYFFDWGDARIVDVNKLR